jgi:RimJ/RimL family protein N-acetyltransferase
MVKIREVKVSDWEKLQNLLYDLVNEEPPVALELQPLIMKGKQWIAQFPKGNLGYFLIAEEDECIVAFCYVAVPQYYKPIAFIGIAVQKSHRHLELGSQMFYEVASWAVSEHLQYLVADIWDWNFKSVKFFEKLGFEEKERFTEKFKGEERQKIRVVKKL